MALSFEERVKNEIIAGAKVYNDFFLEYDYLICSSIFQHKPFYIVSAHKKNFLHLTGVGITLSREDFFDKSYSGNLQTTDQKNKGSIRRKVKVLSSIGNIFDYNVLEQEDFNKNKVHCSFAATELNLTLGFVNNRVSLPMTLLKGVEIDLSKAAKLDLVFRKDKASNVFDEIIVGNNYTLKCYHSEIKHLFSKGYQDMY